jgi:hypothetical protein
MVGRTLNPDELLTLIEHAGIGARVLRVQADDDWLIADEIAERVGRSRSSATNLKPCQHTAEAFT